MTAGTLTATILAATSQDAIDIARRKHTADLALRGARVAPGYGHETKRMRALADGMSYWRVVLELEWAR